MMQEIKEEAEQARNPMFVVRNAGEDLGLLLEQEMTEGILNLSNEARGQLLAKLEQLRRDSYQQPQPAMLYKLRLFRQYADIANEIKDHPRTSSGSAGDSAFMAEIPSFVYEMDEGQLVGWAAVRTYAFWLRFCTAAMSFISVVFMATFPHIDKPDLEPIQILDWSCSWKIRGYFVGTFNMRPYQLIMSVGVVAYVYSFCIAIYFILPVDSRNRKIFPGLKWLLGGCMMDAAAIDDLEDTISTKLQLFSKSMLALSDGVILSLCCSSFIIGSISLERSSPFQVGQEYVTQYYTLASFFMTYLSSTPRCISYDPVPLIRASLACFFFLVAFQCLIFQSSFAAFRLESRTRASRSHVSIRTSAAAAASGNTSNGPDDEDADVEMRAAPVFTEDPDEVSDNYDV